MWIEPKFVTLHSAAAAAATGTVPFLEGRFGTAIVQVTGVTTGSMTFQGSIDGTNYANLLAKNMTTGAVGATATANGIYMVPVVGLRHFKTPVTAITEGTFTVVANIIPDVATDPVPVA